MRAQAELSTLLFMLFIHVADADHDMTPQEVQGLNNLLDDPRWARTEALRVAIGVARTNYAAVWGAYDTGRLTVDRDVVAAALGDAFEGLAADEAGALHASLADFLRRLTRAGTSSFSLLGVSPLSKGRVQARDEIEVVLKTFAPGATGEVILAPETTAMAIPGRDAAARRATTRGDNRPVTTVLSSPHTAEEPPRTPQSAPWPDVDAAFRHPDALEGGRLRVRCVRVIQETADVKTYVFASLEHGLFRFRPGQFVTLELAVEGRMLRRSYTISSSPSRPFTLSITVKRLPMGWASNWLYERMEAGLELDLRGPSGDFTCIDHPAEKLLLVSAGSGVTPMMSMLRFLVDTAAPVDVCFINNVRTPADIIFRDELLHLSAQSGPLLKLHIVPARLAVGRSWNGMTGPISRTLLQALTPDFASRETFVCGPAGYMTAVRELLQELDHPMQRFHEESFGGSARPPARPAETKEVAAPSRPAATRVARTSVEPVHVRMPQVQEEVEVVFSRSGRVVRGLSGETVLSLALGAGIDIASSCRAGVCGVCRITKIDGLVEMSKQSILSDDEIEAGEILACSARVHGRVVVDA